MVGKRPDYLDTYGNSNTEAALDEEFDGGAYRRQSEEEGDYASLQKRDPEPSAPSKPKVDPPWKNIKKKNPKMQLVSKTSRADSMCYLFTLKFFRLLCFGFSFILILGSSVMSKLVLSLMSYQNMPNRTMELCVTTPNKLFTVVTSPFERIAWSWSLWFVLIIPEILVFLESLWICFFKKATFPSVLSFCAVFLGETLHVIGICLLVFEVLPTLDAIRGIMFLNSLSFIPACLSILSRNKDHYFPLKIAADMVCMVGLMAGTILWAFEERMWILPITGVLISCNWWENYVSKESSVNFITTLAKFKKKLQKLNGRYFAYIFVSLWKILITFLALIIHLVVHSTPPHEELLDYLGDFTAGFRDQPVRLIQAWRTSSETLTGNAGGTLTSAGYLPVYLLLFQAGCSLLCYLVSVFACRIRIQEFSFSFALMISTPIAIFLSSSACSWRAENACFLTNIFPEYVYWKCPSHGFFDTFLAYQYGWVWLVWFVSQVWFTSHIWFKPNRNPDRFFVTPMYSGVIVEQSLVTNRINESDKVGERMENNEEIRTNRELYSNARSNTLIYGCATMWHEDKDEMKDMMKSVMRMDVTLQKERLKQRLSGVEHKKYNFDFETHIFFDDAFTIKKNVKVVNNFVKDLIKSKLEAEKSIYGKTEVKIGNPPTIYHTPYGGRIEWILPGQSNVYVHLKDKLKIKAKKRWSQVMYMFYLLGHILLDPRQYHNIESNEENTFILALDGDVDFKPEAVQRLLDLMQKNSLLGAACGRIHPVGQGLIPWYQRFEYAIGHWLQKATEHVTGCVLCSPGCFSLFRAKALLEVMETYSQNATQPKEMVQFDLGEDRWLCTLLLKRGYRIEYSAASDAYTRCPDSFKVFYNQRRRWGPSTMVNIMDILTGWKDTVRQNNSISTLYIMYTGLIMVGTILGPGTIFLMVTGSISAAFQVSNMTALLTNLIPITIFILICFFAKEEIQLLLAGILSTLYALLMMAVLIGVIIQLQEDGVTSPTGLFLIALASSFVVAAILHPQEFHCLKHGILYFLLVPSMYLLLTLYSLINMNNISWGTRETIETGEKAKETDPNAKTPDPNSKTPDPNAKIPTTNKNPNDQGSYFATLTKLFDNTKRQETVASRLCSCFLCTTDQDDEATKKLLHKVEFIVEDTRNMVSHLERNTIGPRTIGLMSPAIKGDKQFIPPSAGANTSLQPVIENDYSNSEEVKESNPLETELSAADNAKDGGAGKLEEEKKKEEIWAKAKIFKGCDIKPLEDDEMLFWTEMMKDYLTPDKRLPKEEQKEEDKKIKANLRDMRNNYIFAFFMLNGLFILVVFLLQLNKDDLYIIWPINAKTNVTYIPISSVISIDREYLHLEPFGFVFALFFGVILVLQFFAMLVHRFGTFTHLMGDTKLSCKVNMTEEMDFEEENGGKKDEEEDEFEEQSGKRKSIAPQTLVACKDVSKRRVSTIYLQVDQQEPEVAETLEEYYINKLKQEVQAAGAINDAPVLKKMSKKMLARRRMSQDPRFMQMLNRIEDDTESNFSRTNSVRSVRTESNASRFSNARMYQKRQGSNKSSRPALNRLRSQPPFREVSNEDIPMSYVDRTRIIPPGNRREVLTLTTEGYNNEGYSNEGEHV